MRLSLCLYLSVFVCPCKKVALFGQKKVSRFERTNLSGVIKYILHLYAYRFKSRMKIYARNSTENFEFWVANLVIKILANTYNNDNVILS